MLGIVAHVFSNGKAAIYVQVRKDIGSGYPGWDGRTMTSLEQHHLFWSFERASFEAHLPESSERVSESRDSSHERPSPDEPASNRGGRPPEFNLVDLLTEAFIYVAVEGLPNTMEGEGGLHEKLKLRLGSRCPERTRFREIFSPIFQHIRQGRQGRQGR